jgi:glutaredoxin
MASSEHPFGTLESPSLQDRKVIVYTSSGCPKCAALKRWLRNRHADFEERSLEDVEVMAGLIMRDIFVLSAPALEVKGIVYTEDQIFDGDGAVKSELLDVVEGR